jgi:dephospho-CoA kinase
MKAVGLTGGIGSGKSVVAAMLRDLGAATIDTDAVARKVVAPGSAGLAEIVARFGRDVLAADGSLDRDKLGKMVFGDPQARGDLEAITHPRIWQAVGERIQRETAKGTALLVVEVPLLFETNAQSMFAAVICVTASRANRIVRIKARSGYDEARIAGILDAQIDPAKQASMADFVIDNDGDLNETRRQVESVFRALTSS